MTEQYNEFHSDLFKKMHDPSSINLAVGQPNFRPPKQILDMLKENIGVYTGYVDIEGLPELRNQIKKKLLDENKIKTERVVVTNGAIEAIFDSMLTHLKSGSEIILFSPHYGKYVTVPNLMEAKIKIIPLNNNRPDLETLERSITKKTRMIVVNSPCNPTGIVYSKDEIKQIVEIVDEHDLILLSDEVYEKYVYDGKKHISPGSYSDRVITINSFSKTYGFPGLRLGYLAGAADLVDPILNIHLSNTTCSPYASQIAAITALKLGYNFFDLLSFDKRRKLIIQKLNENGVSYIHPEGAFYFYIYIDKNPINFINKLLRKKLLVMPSKWFGDISNAIRISYTVDINTLEKGLKILTKNL